MNTTITLAPLLSTKAMAVRQAIAGLEAFVPIRPETRALAESGSTVQALLDAIAGDLEIAEVLTVDSEELMAEAQQIAGRIATVKGKAEEERQALTVPFYDVKKVLDSGYNDLVNHLSGRISDLNLRVVRFANEQRRIAVENEAKAARERAEQQRIAHEAEQAAQRDAQRLIGEAAAAAQAGDTDTAQVKATEAAVVSDAGRQAAQDLLHASYARLPSSAPAAPKGMRDTWTASVTSLQDLILHVADKLRAGDASLVNLLLANQPALNAKAKIEKTGFSVPGVRADGGQAISTRKVKVA